MMHDNTLVTYVINLKRSTERMENMDRALKAMQVDYERVEGVDAQRLSEDLLSRNATPSVEYPYELTKGELACFYSHRKCWKMLANSQHEWALGSSSKPPSLIDGEANLFKLGAFDRGLKSVESSRER